MEDGFVEVLTVAAPHIHHVVVHFGDLADEAGAVMLGREVEAVGVILDDVLNASFDVFELEQSAEFIRILCGESNLTTADGIRPDGIHIIPPPYQSCRAE